MVSPLGQAIADSTAGHLAQRELREEGIWVSLLLLFGIHQHCSWFCLTWLVFIIVMIVRMQQIGNCEMYHALYMPHSLVMSGMDGVMWGQEPRFRVLRDPYTTQEC